jgi:predicted dehydrogenase
METEDFAAALLALASGGVATLMATTAAYPGAAESIRLVCRNGSAALEGNSLTINPMSGAAETFTSDTGTGSGANPMDFSSGPHKALITDFIEAVEGGRAPAVTGEDCLATQRLIEAILTSANRKSWVEVAD